MFSRVAFPLAFTVIAAVAAAAEPGARWGYPIVMSYGAAEMQDSPESYSFCALPNGTLLVGGQGLHEYDGDRWTYSPCDLEAVYSLDRADDGRVWAGAEGEVGWFDRQPDGHWKFHSIAAQVDLHGQVWKIFSVGAGAVFVTTDRVYRWNGQTVQTWTIAGVAHLTAHRIAGHIYLNTGNSGLYELTEQGPKLLIEASQIPGNPSYVSWIDPQADRWLLATIEGLFEYRNGAVKAIAPELSRLLKQGVPVCGARLKDGRLAFGTFHSGIILADANGKPLEQLAEDAGIPRYIDSVQVDANDQLWAATRQGVFRINFDDKTRIFDDRAGIKTNRGGIFSIAATGDRVAVTNLGATYLLTDRKNFVVTNEFGGAAHTVTASGDAFLVAGHRRLWLNTSGGSKELASIAGDFYTAVPSIAHAGDILVSDYFDVKIIQPSGRNIEIAPGTKSLVTSFAEDRLENLLWLGSSTMGLNVVDYGTLRPQQLRPPDPRFGLPPLPPAVTAASTAAGDVLVFADTGGWIKRRGSSKFAQIPGYKIRPVSAVSNVLDDGTLWVAFAGSPALAPSLMRIVTQPEPHAFPYSFLGLDAVGPLDGLFAQRTKEGTVLWIGGRSVVRHIVDLSSSIRRPLPPSVSVYVNEGADQRHRLDGALPFSNAGLVFEISESDFARRPMLRLETQISGIDPAWVRLGKDSTRELTAIRDGTYTLRARAVAESGLASESAGFTFTVLPPWWRTETALWMESIVFVGLMFGGVQWRLRTLQRRTAQLEQKVQERTAELKRANRAKDEFLASMSHEIRNPLNGVIGIAGMIRDSAAQQRDRRLADSLHACADQLRLVLDDILDFSRIERGDVEIHRSAFDPAAAVRTAAIAVDVSLERTRIAVAPEIAGCWLLGDEAKVRQIVSNLVSNAHKYGVPPEADILVGYRDGKLQISVANTGPDIPLEDQARIFDSFERGRTAAHKYVRGVGLGLTISSRFARAMGGTLRVESAQGLTCFALSVPMPPAAEKSPATTTIDGRGRGRALAVEDETYNRLVLGHLLAPLGLAVDWAQTGAEAIEAFRAGTTYDVVFTDWMLPDMSGAELVRKLQELGGTPTPPIVAVTAYATEEKRAEAVRAGVSAFVTKPITREKIVAALPSWADRADSGRRDPEPTHEDLRFAVLLDTENPAERIADFRRQLQSRMDEMEAALRRGDGDAAARAAHQLASQVLSLHHHTFADQLRAFEHAVTQQRWHEARELHPLNREAATQLARWLDVLGAKIAKTASTPID